MSSLSAHLVIDARVREMKWRYVERSKILEESVEYHCNRGLMNDQRLDSIERAIRHLLPSVRIERRFVEPQALRDEFGQDPNLNPQCGHRVDGSELHFWLALQGGKVAVLDVKGVHLPLTKKEVRIFKAFEQTMGGLLLADGVPRGERTTTRLAGEFAFQHLLVSRHVRGAQANTFWSVALVLKLLEDLAVRRYEGHPCSSGFAFVTEPKRYVAAVQKRADASVEVLPFNELIELSPSFFDEPASYRLVDGRNAFYLVDNHRRVWGVARIANPKKYSLVDRAARKHVVPFFEIDECRAFVAYVGTHDDVNVVLRDETVFRWEQLYWRFLDPEKVKQVLVDIGEVEGTAASGLLSLLLTLSDLRFGSLVLIPADEAKRPSVAASIDSSPFGAALTRWLRDASINDLIRRHSAVGIFTSDGITTVGRDGRLLGFGEILQVGDGESGGGGRTQAALTASAFGLAIKVSEDGPISFYKNRVKMLEIAV